MYLVSTASVSTVSVISLVVSQLRWPMQILIIMDNQ